jgi:hypothetical protein
MIDGRMTDDRRKRRVTDDGMADSGRKRGIIGKIVACTLIRIYTWLLF